MLRSLFRSPPETEERAQQVLPYGPWDNTYNTAGGINVNVDSATQLLAVYGSVQLIADTIATLPLHVYRKQGDSQIEVAAPSWLDQPNEYANITDFITQTLWSLLLEGNAYWVYGLNSAFGTNYLTILDPCKVNIETATHRDGTKTVVYKVDGEPFAGRILHLKGIVRPGDVKGVSPVEAARQGIGVGLAAETFAANFYKNGASPTLGISVPSKLGPDNARQIKESAVRAMSGLNNAHLPFVIDNGGTFTQLGVTPEQAQFLATRQHSGASIAGQIFLLDPTMLGMPVQSNNLTYANLEQRGIHLVQFTLLRWIIRLERAFAFLLPRPQYVKFKVAALERADIATRYAAHRVALGPNVPFEDYQEVRDFEELGPASQILKDQMKTATTPPPSTLQPFAPPAQSQSQSNGVGANT